jgi:energy-coupling factor transporter ATP-binding protein EcfA2
MFEGIDPSIGKILQKFVEQPETLSHLLFVGPPGSGKTTTAHSLVKAFYNQRKTFTGKALFLNSSDERSLEAVRSKVYPFARSQIHVLFGSDFFQKKAPKIIIFDEAETLTEQAQSALRPLLDKPASELLIIFLCNSISRIHSSILHRFLRIYFETPSADQFRNRFQPIFEMTHAGGNQQKINEISKMIAPADIYYRRGDIRFFLLQYNKSRECNTFGWLLLHTPTQELFSFIERSAQSTFLGELINQALFLFQSLGCIEPDDISQLLTFADAQILSVRPQKETLFDFCKWILHLRSKFDF